MTNKWRTAITSTFKRQCVLRASLGGGLGVMILVGAGSFLPLQFLESWGLPLFFASLGLITWSMLPYKQLVQLENKPDELWLNTKGDIVYAKKGIPTFTVPQNSLEKMFFIQKTNEYGICLSIKQHPREKVRIHNPNFDYATINHKNLRKYGCDIFLPFFSERTFKDLQDTLNELNS